VTEKTPEEEYYKSSGLRPKGVNPLVILMVLSGAAAIAVFAIAAQWSARPECLNTFLSESLAPDGAHRAVVFARQCGRDLPIEGHVSILIAGESFGDAPGNAAIVVPISVTDENSRWRSADIAAAWADGRLLTITYRDGLTLVTAAPHVGLVTVAASVKAAPQP
jgi:hypothetical protein